MIKRMQNLKFEKSLETLNRKLNNMAKGNKSFNKNLFRNK